LNFFEPPSTYGIYTEPRGFFSLGILVKLTITSQTTKFNTQNLSLWAYGGSSFVKTELNLFSLAEMVVFEVETSMDCKGYPVNFGAQCRLFPDDQNFQQRNRTL
jgi:hypothetical protein